ncbi:ketopantoate reductase family protein [Halomonas sp. V046]|uniref:ketopantoate reductase family protein n=1 Tax=Halomonas sp. V046 TaxID=3459611 RepID=UPI00404466C7
MIPRRSLVVGPGAIGRWLAMSLSMASARHEEQAHAPNVRLLGRRLLPNDQTLTSPNGTLHHRTIDTFTDMRRAAQDIDWVHFTTKAYATQAVFDALAPHLAADTPVVLWQNGLRVQQPITAVWSGPVLCASTTEGAYVVSDTQVVHAGHGETLIGHLHGRHQDTARALAGHLADAGLACAAVDDIGNRLWHKLVVNAAINPLVARYQIRNGQLRDRPFRPMLDATVDELAELMTALEIPPPRTGNGDDPRRPWHALVWRVIDGTANNRASMLQDRQANRPTEHDAILGPLLDAAAEHAIATPCLSRRWQELNA